MSECTHDCSSCSENCSEREQDLSAKLNPEGVFIQIGKGNDDDPVYKMNTAEKECLDSYMEARNNALLWGKSNMDESGKP